MIRSLFQLCAFTPLRIAGLRIYIARLVLLIALLASGMVPQGMMRVPDATGSRLVLCTGNGPREIWMADDGTVSDRALSPTLPAENGDVGTCLAVTFSFAAVQTAVAALAVPADFSPFRPALTAPRAPHPTHRSPTQPRAPPILS